VTSSSSLILSLEVQKKAQAEIDAVVGSDRLPSFQDIPNLPYVKAMVTEILRWNSVAPTGVPHRATEDEIIADYFVPKDSIIMCNLWYCILLHSFSKIFFLTKHIGT
jgi:cytochrome P450